MPLGYEPPEAGSSAYVAFEEAYWELFQFLAFVLHVSSIADELRSRISQMRDILTQVPSNGGKPDASDDAATVATFAQALEDQNRFIFETLTVRGVDNYLTYLKDILYLICRAKPEVLRSKKLVRMDLVLNFTDMTDLVDALAERTVQDLSYGSLYDLADFFEDRLGLRIAKNASDLSHLVILVEIRNLIVHNRGIVNAVFLKKTATAIKILGSELKANWKIGDTIDFGAGQKGMSFLAKSAHLIDTEASAKFSLEQVAAYVVGQNVPDFVKDENEQS